LRLRHYEASAAGNAEQAVQEAQAMYAEAVKQMDVILSDIDGAVKYIVDGINEHPNRIDITEGKTGPAPSQAPSSFGQPAVNSQPSPFGQPSTSTPGFGQPSALGGTSAFGKPSGFGQPSAFGQPSSLGQGSSFGQPGALGQGSAFGQPSGLGAQSGFGKPAFGQPTMGQPAFGQSSFGQSSFGQPSSLGAPSLGTSTGASPFDQISNQNQSQGMSGGFGQAASAVSPFAQAASQQSAAASTGFGQPSTTPTATGAFGQPTQTPSPFGQAQQLSNPFGQPSTAPDPFGGVSQQPQQQAAPSPFGQPAAGFTQAAQQQTPVPTATPGTGPPPIIKMEDPNQLNPIPPLPGQTIRDPMTKRLSSWKGQPVKYIENSPCYLHPQDRKTYVRIFFPDGPPDGASLRDATAKPEEYTPEVTEQYEFFVKNGYFKDGVIPRIPPKTEWVSFDF
jgi:nucleoporin NUP42